MKNASKNQGFSLIELIVVVAIMAVLVVILAPALLQYNERSRAERDNSAMDEVVNAVQLALADAQIYDEVVAFSTVDNISCYVDTDSEANYTRIVTKSNPDGVDQYTFDSTSRQLDETPYYAAGNMRGVTLTFAPDKGSNGSTFDFKQGVVNQYVQIKGNHRVGALQGLYGRIDSSVGESLEIKSPTYRNSEYTIFIRLGSTGGNDESKQNSIQTYGQWSGTNLPAEVSYKLVSDRSIGDPGNQIVEINDSKWNSTNGTKITVKPGDLNGGGSFTPGTETGNKDGYTAEDFAEDEKGIYAYLINGNTLVLRNSPRQDMSNVTKDYGILDAIHNRKWDAEKLQIEYVDIETPILPKRCSLWFYNCKNLIEIKNLKNLCMDDCTNTSQMFHGCSNLTELDVSNFNTANVTTMYYMFCNCSNLKELDVSNFDTSKVTNMCGMLGYCSNLTELDVSNFDTTNVTNMGGMFMLCTNLTELDVSNFNTSNCVDFYGMFNSVMVENIDVSNFDTSKATTMQNMFYYCQNLEKLDVSGFDTSNVKSFEGMFQSCKKLKEIDVSNWNTSNVENLCKTFYGCHTVQKLDVSNWDVSKVKTLFETFRDCDAVQELDVSNWNPYSCTTLSYTFRGCKSVAKLDLSNWDTSQVTDMSATFTQCENLSELYISNLNTSKVKSICNLVQGTKIQKLDLESWDVSNVTNMSSVFSCARSLTELKISTWDTSSVTNMQNMFDSCPAPKPSWYTA